MHIIHNTAFNKMEFQLIHVINTVRNAKLYEHPLKMWKYISEIMVFINNRLS